ncbi:MAG: hypothetical protein ACKOFO_11700 [Gemmatimonadota bacterium]
MEQLLPVLFILAAGLIDLIQRWQRRAKRPPLERDSEPERSSPEIIFDLEEILRGTARPRKPAPPPARPTPTAPSARRAPAPAPEGPRGPRPVVQPVARAPHPVLHTLQRPADVRQAIVVSTILGRCPGME